MKYERGHRSGIRTFAKLAIAAASVGVLFGVSISASADTITVTPVGGYGISWDGISGPAVVANPATPTVFPVPYGNDLALASNGGSAFASSQLSPTVAIHQTVHLNDGFYSNSNSWISAAGDPNPYAGIALSGLTDITSFAFSRDNALETQNPNCNLGPCTDRWVGTYTIQITTDADPSTSTHWTTVGTLNYASGGPGTAVGYLRHDYTISAPGGGGIEATGLRILVPDAFGSGASGGTDIDEIEVFAPEPASLSLIGLGAMSLLARRRRV